MWNFSLQDYLEITITNDAMDFTTLALLDVDDTTDNNPAPFTFENTGNIGANLTNISSMGIWTMAALGTSYYQFKVDNASESGSFDWSQSMTTWQNMTAGGILSSVVSYLNYSVANNDVAVEIKLQVPPGEPPGSKSDTITFTWEASD